MPPPDRPLSPDATSSEPADGSLAVFFLATYALTWTCFITVAAAIPASTLPGQLLVLLGAFSPSLVALSLTARRDGARGVHGLLRRSFQWRVGVRWYVFGVGYIVAVKFAVAVLHRAISGAWPHFELSRWFVIPFAIAFSAPFQAGEEIGWRGYALPRLSARLGLGWSSVLLGIIWAIWHLPQFYIRGADTYGQSFFVFSLQVTALSVAFAWLWSRTGRSLLPTMLLHSSVNNAKDVVPSAMPDAGQVFGLHASLVAWLTAAVLWACAAFFMASMARDGPRSAPISG